jgi:hypothetical protein
VFLGKRRLRVPLSFWVSIDITSDVFVWSSRGEILLRSTELEVHYPGLRNVWLYERALIFEEEENVFAPKAFMNL